MKKLLIVHHSQSGSTERLAHAAAAGAAEEATVEVRWLRAAEAGAADLAWCDGLLLATPRVGPADDAASPRIRLGIRERARKG